MLEKPGNPQTEGTQKHKKRKKPKKQKLIQESTRESHQIPIRREKILKNMNEYESVWENPTEIREIPKK